VYAGARTTKAQIVLGMYHPETDPIAELVELAGRRLDGVIVANGGDITVEAIDRIAATGIPCVLIENRVDRPISSVSSDNFSAGREATQHLIDLGHTRIGLIKGSERYASLHDRYRGYVVALAEAGISVDTELIAPQGEHLARKGYDQARRLLELPEPPTAIYAISDKSAFGALAAVTDAGLEVGKDISVVGTDNVEASAYSVPALTTFDTGSRELGTVALRTLTNLVAGDDSVTHTVVQGSLVVRESTGSPGVRSSRSRTQ
jgi:DNA-binding LacI/PurR family transcriptional regulator